MIIKLLLINYKDKKYFLFQYLFKNFIFNFFIRLFFIFFYRYFNHIKDSSLSFLFERF